MRGLSEIWTRLRALVGRDSMERELEKEIAFHIERETEKHVARGLSADVARREALRRFGGVERHRERTREAWGVRGIEEAAQDMHLGLRRMARSPGFSFVAVLTLALGIGGTVALYSVVHGLLVRPLPFRDADRLVVFWQDFDWRGVEFDFAKEQTRAYDGLAAFTVEGFTVRRESESLPVTVGLTSAELFDVVGAEPLLGRTFGSGEDRPGRAPVVVLSHDLWQQIGGDSAVVGSSLVIDGVSTTVIGVMPRAFYFPAPDIGAWMPLLLDPASQAYRGRGWLAVLGRLAPGIDEARLQADLGALGQALGERFAYTEAWDKSRDPFVRPLRTYLFGDVKTVVLLLLGATGLLLLIATANVAAMILARTFDRTPEMEVRASLGAGRGRLARQILTESFLLAGLAGILGTGMAAGSFEWLVSRLPLQQGFGRTLYFEWRLLLGAAAVASLVGCLVALLPSRRLLGGAATLSARKLSAGTRAATHAQGALVAAEVFFAVVLMTGATLFTRSVARLHAVDVGVEPAGVGAIDLLVGGPDEMSDAEVEAFYRSAVANVQALPGVASAALTVRLPLRGDGIQGSVAIEDRPDLTDALTPSAYWRPVTTRYFATLGVDLVEGRLFEESDRGGTPEVALVSARFALELWPGESALGKRIQPSAFETQWATVVGVVEDVPVSGVRATTPRIVYRPDAQRTIPWRGHVLVFRSEGDPAALFASVREAVRRADPRAALARPITMDEVVAQSIGDVLQVRFFLGLLATLALAMGCVGVYGVVSYSVSRRKTEYGVRMALGADARRLVVGVLGKEMVPVLVGVVLGLAGALGAARAIAGLLWEVRPGDPVSLAVAAGILLACGVLAILLPAIRATSVNPAVALSRE